jgi:MFS family permease
VISAAPSNVQSELHVGVAQLQWVVCALSARSTMLVVGRADMAIGAAGSEPGTLSMIRHLCSEQKRRARAVGAWAAVSGAALAMGPVLGGVLVGFRSCRAVFWFDLAFGRLAFLAGMVVPPESSDPSKDRPDVRGFVLER